MKCKVLCLLLCVLFCFSCFSLSSSAVDIPDDVNDLIDRGWLYDASDDTYYLTSDMFDPILYGPASLFYPEPHYPDFDVKKIPWSYAPEHIKKYIYMAFSFDLSNYCVPFVCVRVAGSTANVYVGYNLGFGYDGVNDRYRICTPYFTSDCNSACYSASFSTSDYSIKSDWIQLSLMDWGDTGKIKSYTSTLAYSYSLYDFYFYGGAGVKRGEATSVAYQLYSSGGTCSFEMDYELGYQSGRFFTYQNHEENFMYGQYFVPPSASEQEALKQQQIIDGQQEMIEKQEESNETQKGMWESIKALPSQIANSIKGFFTSLGDRISGFFVKLVEDIKGLFVPSEGFFDTYTESFQTYFEERLGILYELPEAVVGILQQFLTFKPATDGYYIPIPEVVLPVKLEDGTYQNFTIFAQQNYKFDFLSTGAIGTLYSFYRAFCWLVCILSLIYFAIRKFEKLTGG